MSLYYGNAPSPPQGGGDNFHTDLLLSQLFIRVNKIVLAMQIDQKISRLLTGV